MIENILEHGTAGFWSFCGTFMILALFAGVITAVCNTLLKCWNRMMLSVRKHGWPPSHLDADGDSVEMTKYTSAAREMEAKARVAEAKYEA